MAELTLARGFPRADEAAWKALVEEALRGAPFSALRSKSYDGIDIEPLYARATEASRLLGRAPGAPWAAGRGAVSRDRPSPPARPAAA